MKKVSKCISLIDFCIKPKDIKYITLIFLIFSFIISCKKKEQENNTTTTLDQLSDSQIQLIEAAGIDTVSTFKDALFPDGTNMSKWESRNDSGHVQVFGRDHPASDKRLLFIDNFTNAAFKLIIRSNYNFQGQKGLAYVYGSKSFSNPSNYPGATCQQLLYGLDCSGMIYEMAKASDLNLPLDGGTPGYIKITTWNTAFNNSTDFQGLEMTDLLNLEPSQLQAGDIIVASGVHMGMVFNNGTSLGIFNSLGRSKYPCSKNSDKDHGPVITKNLLNWLKTTFGTNYHVLRVVQNGTPGLSTTDISSKTSTSAISGGNITNQGGSAITARGVCWSTSHDPTIALPTKTSDGTGTGSFTSSITNLTANTTYYVRAYATNSAGTAYGNEVSFTTANNVVNEMVISEPFIGFVYIGKQNQGYRFACKLKISKPLRYSSPGSFYPKVGINTIADGTFNMFNETEDANYYYYDVIQYVNGGYGVFTTFQIIIANSTKVFFESNIISTVTPALPIPVKYL